MLGVIKLNGPAINVFGPSGAATSSTNVDRRDLNQRPVEQEDLGDDDQNASATNPSTGRVKKSEFHFVVSFIIIHI